jgi:hypothetical protein
MASSAVEVLEAKAVQVTWWPGRSIVARFEVQLVGGGLNGCHQLVALAGELPDHVTVVEGDEGRVGVWRMPHDPFLPGLKYALDPVAAGGVLTDLGLGGSAYRPRLVSYRPGNRAVVSVRGPSGGVYLKLVAPHRIGRLHAIHRRIATRLPIPMSLAIDPDLGLVALQELPGTTLREALSSSQPLPDPEDVLGLLASFPEPTSKQVSPSPLERVPALISMLTALVPDQVVTLTSLSAAIGRETSSVLVPVHGDFYEAQVMIRSGKVVGMLDVDTFGWGRPANDAATMIGHLAVLDQSKPDSPVRVWSSRLLKRCDQTYDPVDLRKRVAAVILGLASGPFRVQRQDWPQLTRARIGLASRWCQSAARVAGQGEDDFSKLLTSRPSATAG